MSNMRKHIGIVCITALMAPVFAAQPGFAEGKREAAPIVFSTAASVGSVRTSVGGPLDIRPGAQPTKFEASPPYAQPSALSGAAPAPDGWSRPYAGPPYQVNGKWFVPMHEPDYDEVGIASWYGPGFNGELSSSGEKFDQDALTAAHPTLPIPSIVRVTNLENNRSVLLRLNDRGPYVDDRIIDLSRGAADALDVRRQGTAKVRVQYVGPAPADPDTQVTERMLVKASSQAPQPAPARSNNVWSTPMPAAAGMPDRPSSQASDEGYARPEDVAPVAVRPTPVTTASAPRSGYALQVGSFSDLSNAHRALSAYDNQAGYVASAVVNGGQFYRVMLGPWPDKAAAETAKQNLAATGKSSLVVSLNQ